MRRQAIIILFLILNFLAFFLLSLTNFINVLFLEGIMCVFIGTFLASGIVGSRLTDAMRSNLQKTKNTLLDKREKTKESQIHIGAPLIVSGFVLIAISILISVILERG
jgi:hypothetical protein